MYPGCSIVQWLNIQICPISCSQREADIEEQQYKTVFASLKSAFDVAKLVDKNNSAEMPTVAAKG